MLGATEASSWASYFSIERIMQIRQDFDKAMDGWKFDAEEVHRTFSIEVRRKNCRGTPTPKLVQPNGVGKLRTAPKKSQQINVEVTPKPKRRRDDNPLNKREKEIESSQTKNKDRKKSKKRKKDRLPPPVVIPAPKNRRESLLTAAPVRLDGHLIRPAPEPSKTPIVAKASDQLPLEEDLDVFVPIHVVIGRPATRVHHAKLTRFVQSLREAGKSVPFLLRNINVEPE